MGQPDRLGGRLPHDPRLQPLRQCRSPPLPADPRGRRPHRPARHLLGAGEMGGEAARALDIGQSRAVSHQHGRRPCRCVRALLPPRGDRLHLRLRAQDDRKGPRRAIVVRGSRDACRRLRIVEPSSCRVREILAFGPTRRVPAARLFSVSFQYFVRLRLRTDSRAAPCGVNL